MVQIRDLVIIGVLVIAFLAVPAAAEQKSGAINRPMNSDVALLSSTGDNTAPGVQGITPSTAYTTYMYVWNHGSSAITESDPDVRSVATYGWGHRTTLKNASESRWTDVWIDCPLMAVASFTGKHPVIRYGAMQYYTEQSNTGGAVVQEMDFYNGKDKLKYLYMFGKTDSSWQLMTWDLGAYYDFQRGFNAVVLMKNGDEAGDRFMVIGGFGAKGEWS